MQACHPSRRTFVGCGIDFNLVCPCARSVRVRAVSSKWSSVQNRLFRWEADVSSLTFFAHHSDSLCSFRRRPKNEIKSLKERLAALESVIQAKTICATDSGARHPISNPEPHVWIASDVRNVIGIDRNLKNVTGYTGMPTYSGSAPDQQNHISRMGHDNDVNGHSLPRETEHGSGACIKCSTTSRLDCQSAKRVSMKAQPRRDFDSRENEGNSWRGSDQAAENAHKKAERLLRRISGAGEDYLLDLAWTNYLAMFSFVSRELFSQAKHDHNPEYYCSSLHLLILLHGLFFADRSRPDLQPLMEGSWPRCEAYVVAKCLIDEELEKSKALPLVQSLILLGLMEAGLGRLNSGWMYIGKQISSSEPTPFATRKCVFCVD